MKPKPGESLRFATSAALDVWLAKNHATSDGIWLEIAKKGSEHTTPNAVETLELMLTWGWIDGQRGSKDADFFVQRYTPRRAKSKWSKINCAKVLALTAAKKMKPAGLAQVAAAKKDGRWEKAYAGSRAITVPPDLAKELVKCPKAKAFFESLDSQNRYAILYRLHMTEKPELRVKKLEKYVTMLVENRKIYERGER